MLIAVDKFKGSISALETTQAIASTIRRLRPDWKISTAPIADGGDGTLAIVLDHGYRAETVLVSDALLHAKNSNYAVSKDEKKIFIEMATICGIAQLSELNGFAASSFGLGQAAKAALNHNPDEIVISLGGSASTDGGLGFLIALGAIALDSNGNGVTPNLAGIDTIKSLDVTAIDSRVQQSSWRFLTDVDNPLVGINGAAQIFGLQKGIKVQDLARADALLTRWADLLEQETGINPRNTPGSGAAGGVAAAGLSVLKAKIESGFDWIANVTKLQSLIESTDVVITGEGSFDQQSLMGKGPGEIIKLAQAANKQICVIAGKIDADILGQIPCVALVDLAPSAEESIQNPQVWLTVATEKLLREIDSD